MAASTSTLFGISPAAADRNQVPLEQRTRASVCFDHEQVRVLLGGALGQLLGVVDPKRLVVDPRVDHNVGDLAQQVEPRTSDRRCNECFRSSYCHSLAFLGGRPITSCAVEGLRGAGKTVHIVPSPKPHRGSSIMAPS